MVNPHVWKPLRHNVFTTVQKIFCTEEYTMYHPGGEKHPFGNDNFVFKKTRIFRTCLKIKCKIQVLTKIVFIKLNKFSVYLAVFLIFVFDIFAFLIAFTPWDIYWGKLAE